MDLTMSSRAWRWLAVLVPLTALDLALTIHAHLRFHHTRTGPTVMTLGQLLGWTSSAVLLCVIVIVVIGGRRSRRRHGGHYPR
jgi:hypothetical protein